MRSRDLFRQVRVAIQPSDALAKKDATAKRAKDATERAKPRDVSYQVTTPPFSVKITPAPVAAAKDPKETKQAKSK